jgi:hypothetical protein
MHSVEVFDNSPPPWDYAVVRDFQERERNSIPGGQSARTLLFRALAGERGCDGVLLGGNVSSFDGHYEYRSRRVNRNGEEVSWFGTSETGWYPVFVLRGQHAQCIVRLDRRQSTAPEPSVTFLDFYPPVSDEGEPIQVLIQRHVP